jgi:hypothetical protein
MTDRKSPLERVLDVFVFAPVGLAQSAAEEFDDLAEKGRHRVEGQIHTARLVGQFAVQMARGEAKRMMEGALSRAVGVRERWQSGDEWGGDGDSPTTAAFDTDKSGPTPWRAPTSSKSASTPPAGATYGKASTTDLAIPGYDSLSASQVVQRLDGLSRQELEDVREHELANRHRRTILGRVDQLLSGATGEPS